MNRVFKGHAVDRKSYSSFSGGAMDPVEVARIPNGESTIVVEKNTKSTYVAQMFENRKHYVTCRDDDVALQLSDALRKAVKM